MWSLLTCVSIDETESKEIIDLFLIYGQLSRTYCKTHANYKKFIEKVFDDIAITKETEKEMGGKKVKIIETKEVLLNDES